MTKREELMYKIMGQISSTNAPLIFKGGLVTNLVLQENNYLQTNRETVDIDANWIDKAPTMEHMVETIKKSMGKLNSIYSIEPYRSFGKNKSAGLNLIDNTNGQKILSIDIDVKPVENSRIYNLGKISFKGVVPADILSDKICSISSDLVYKYRVKDLIDVYALSQCITISTKEIYQTCKNHNRIIQDFNGLFTKKSLVEHAYNKLSRIDDKPKFDVIHEYISKYVQPFKNQEFDDKVWNAKKEIWENQILNIDKKIPSTPLYISRKQIQKNTERIKSDESHCEYNSHKHSNEIE